MNEMDVNIHFKGGGSIVTHRPVFSDDGENVFVCWKNSLLQYSSKTGKNIYEYKGLENHVVGFSYYNYDYHHCLVACSESGKVMVWKVVTHYKILEQKLPVQKLFTFNIIPSDKEDDLKALVSYKNKKYISFAEVDIKKKVLRDFNIKLTNQKYYIDISGNNYFTLAHDNEIYFVPLSSPKGVQRHHIHSSRTFTCIACHPSEEVVLTGDSTGRVVVWQNIFSREKSQSVFHWHTLPVRTVSFSTSGSYFYSGGGECVLVKWQFDNVNDKKFVPRIAAELEHVSVAKNNVYVAVATSDNTVRIFDSQLYQIALIQHLVLGKQYSSGIVYDPRTRALIMNGNQGQVQFYSPSDMSLLYSVDIVGQNKITNERDATIQNTEIMRVALSKNGHWLATVEERKDEKYQNEIRLKFWKFDNEKQIFELNTSIEYPHEHSVNSMLFQPANKSPELRCVTVANDKKFKIWQLDEVTRVDKKDVAWKCFGIGFFRDQPCRALSFSADGSLMATGFGQILTVWTPDTCHLKCSLIHPLYKEKVKHVQFGYSNQCHLLVSASANQLSVWNLLTLCMVWTVPVRVALLVADPLSTNVAVMTQQKEVFVFSPVSPTPVYSSKDLLKKQENVIAAAFVPSKYSNDTRLMWYERSHFYFITSNNELYCVSGSENPTDATSELPEDGSSFSIMTPNHKTSLAQSATPRRHMYEKDAGHVTLKKYLDAPIHTMAPVRYTCYGLLKSLTVQKDSVS